MKPPLEGRVRQVLVLGATGYVGGRLVSELLDAGHQVRVLTRSRGRAERYEWSGRVRLFIGDVLDAGTLAPAFEGCDAVCYLVHSIGTSGDFAATEAIAALNARDAVDAAGCSRIVYLGGMGRGDALSTHLASRHRVGEILASGSTPTTELRAAVIIGAGSISFEMLRYLTEVLPAMVSPRWVRTKCQPIAIRDVLRYLAAALEDPETIDRVLEIGGPDVVTYAEMMQTYAEVAGLPHRFILPVPFLTPRLSSRWVGLVTPLPASIAVPLIDSLRHEVVMTDHQIDSLVPHQPLGFRESLELRCGSPAPRRSTHGGQTPGSHPPTPFPAIPTGPEGRSSKTTRRSTRSRRAGVVPRVRAGSAGRTGITCRTGRGHFGASPTSSLADQDYGAAGAIPSTCGRAMRSTSGASSMPSRVCSWFSRPR